MIQVYNRRIGKREEERKYKKKEKEEVEKGRRRKGVVGNCFSP
jgi:hypothetical protein